MLAGTVGNTVERNLIDGNERAGVIILDWIDAVFGSGENPDFLAEGNIVRDNLHVILCFSPIGDPIKVRTRRFPALVNCVVIDWFQPWPEEALTSVSKRFLEKVRNVPPAK